MADQSSDSDGERILAPSDFAAADELRQLRELKRVARLCAALLADPAASQPATRTAKVQSSIVLLHQLLKLYQQSHSSPSGQCPARLVHVAHLIRLCASLEPLMSPDNSSSSHWQQLSKRFQPIRVALSRVPLVSDSAVAVAEGDDAAAHADTFPLELVLVNIRSAFNVGSIVRTTECYGGSVVHVAGYTAGLDHPKVAAVAMGCEQHMPWTQADDPAAKLVELQSRGLALVALETGVAATPLPDFRFPFPAALIVGNERFGIEPDILSQCDHIVRLPMYGKKNSLNVAGACAVAIHHARSQ